MILRNSEQEPNILIAEDDRNKLELIFICKKWAYSSSIKGSDCEFEKNAIEKANSEYPNGL